VSICASCGTEIHHAASAIIMNTRCEGSSSSSSAPARCAAVPGTASVAHLRENVAAARLVLPAEVLAELDTIGPAS
jgi:hypothetical protein